jgi:hypothetical protein
MGGIPHLEVGNSYFSMALFQSRAGLWEVLHVEVVRCDCRVAISCQTIQSNNRLIFGQISIGYGNTQGVNTKGVDRMKFRMWLSVCSQAPAYSPLPTRLILPDLKAP